jgi:hypothetical protein
MQYHIQTLVKHLFDKDSFEQVTVQELKQFTDDYPFAAVGQFLYAKKLKESGSYNHYEQNEQASLYFHNALWLRWQLEQKDEAPVLPVKAEEPAQQPGFRIVVQMPKTAPAIISTLPADQPAPPLAPAASHQETTEEPVQPAEASEAAMPVTEETVAEEQGNSLQVNEDGSLVVKETEQAPETPSAPEETNTVAETNSAVAIAESSQLAEESIPTEAPVNAVSITSAILTPGTVVPENTTPPTSDEVTINEERDDIIPAVEVPAEIADTKTVQEEVDEIIPAVEVPAEVIEAAATTAIVPEEQPVEPVTETIAAEEQPPFTAETEQPVTAEDVVDNTTDNQPTAAVPEEPVQAKPEAAPSQPIISTPGKQEGQTTVDLGEPIFESYHTIDYFASQGIKLMQEDFKDKMGKQLKSFTDWLRSMKRIGPLEQNTSLDEVTNQSIQRIAEHSVEEKEVLTEAMAEVWAKQGNTRKAIRVYEKLSLLNPDKSAYFASRIEQLKAL